LKVKQIEVNEGVFMEGVLAWLLCGGISVAGLAA